MSASYQKRRRDAARAAGLCGQCCTRKAEPDRFRCSSCLEHCRKKYTPVEQQRRHAHIPQPKLGPDRFCPDCCAAGFHRYDCIRLGTRAA